VPAAACRSRIREQAPNRVDRLLGRLVLADGAQRGTFFAFQGMRTD
jgi:hypothetical protein